MLRKGDKIFDIRFGVDVSEQIRGFPRAMIGNGARLIAACHARHARDLELFGNCVASLGDCLPKALY